VKGCGFHGTGFSVRTISSGEIARYGIKLRETEGGAENDYYLLTKCGVFAQHSYVDEEELQKLVESNDDKVFGEKSVYVPLKMRVVSPRGARIIDGLFLDFNDPNNPGFKVVEYELRQHSNEHIVAQVKDIYDSFQDRANRSDITRRVWEELRKNPEKLSKSRTLLGTNEVHERIDEALTQNFQVIVVLDQLFEVEDVDTIIDRVVKFHDLGTAIDLSGVDYEFIEFKTYGKDGEFIHYCNGYLARNTYSVEKTE